MEVAPFIRAALRRWWIAVLVALLAGGAAALIKKNTIDQYDGSAVLTVPAVSAATTGANGQYIQNFSTSLTLDEVLREIHSDTGVSTSNLSSGLAATQLGSANLIDITYTANTPAAAKKIVQSAAVRTAEYLARSSVLTAKAGRKQAIARVSAVVAKDDAAHAAMAAYVAKHGPLDPASQVQSLQSAITQLTVSRLQAITQGKSVSGYDSALHSAKAQLKASAPLVSDYQQLQSAVRNADADESSVRNLASVATSTLAAAQAPPLIGSPSAPKVTAQSVIIKVVLIAAGVGLVLGVALVLLLTALRRDRPRRRRRDATVPDAAAQDSAVPATAAPDAAVHHPAPPRNGPRHADEKPIWSPPTQSGQPLEAAQQPESAQ